MSTKLTTAGLVPNANVRFSCEAPVPASGSFVSSERRSSAVPMSKLKRVAEVPAVSSDAVLTGAAKVTRHNDMSGTAQKKKGGAQFLRLAKR